MTRHVLPGLRPTPLASYLAGLGLVRLLGEQADPDLTAAWSADGLVVETALDDIPTWLADQYVPTPVLSPWNEGSGFGTKDKAPKHALDALTFLTTRRLDPFRDALAAATEVGQHYRSAGWTKETAVRELRNRCPESLLPWLDAAVVLADGQAYFPPLLGTGGNDGRLDLSTNFHQRLLEVLDPAPRARTRSLSHARDLLAGAQEEGLHTAAIGQFDPAGAGGRNSSPFGGADSLVNPWAFILLIEGTLLFASSAARRHQHAAGRAAMPFTVTASPDGSASGADGETATSRGEIWAPLWDRPYTVAEIKQLFAEARASWRGRPAQRAAEFYAATRTLGVARGVAAFERFGLHRRNGLAFVAVPEDRVVVAEKPLVRLAAQLEEWVSWVRRGESSTAVGRAVRRFDTADLTFVRDGDPLSLARLLAAVTDLEQAVGRSGRARDAVSVRRPPPAQPFLNALREIECPELRVAVGIASCAVRARPELRLPGRTMRQILLPVDPGDRWRDTPVVPGLGLRPLRNVLADVLVWRSRSVLDDEDTGHYRGVPTFLSGIAVPDDDLHAFATQRGLDVSLDLWLRACLALRWNGVDHDWTDPGPPPLPVPTLGLLHPLAAGLAAGHQPDSDAPRLALGPDWALRLLAGQVGEVHADAVHRLRQAGWTAVGEPLRTGVEGAAIAAALVPRCQKPQRVLSRLAFQTATDQTTEDHQDLETVEGMS